MLGWGLGAGDLLLLLLLPLLLLLILSWLLYLILSLCLFAYIFSLSIWYQLHVTWLKQRQRGAGTTSLPTYVGAGTSLRSKGNKVKSIFVVKSHRFSLASPLAFAAERGR